MQVKDGLFEPCSSHSAHDAQKVKGHSISPEKHPNSFGGQWRLGPQSVTDLIMIQSHQWQQMQCVFKFESS